MLMNRPAIANHAARASRRRYLAELPIAWRKAADTCDDRVSENIFDVEDERAEVDIIVHGMLHGAN